MQYKPKLGLALCGSFCTFARLLEALPALTEQFDITPIVSETVAATDTRFGGAGALMEKLEALCGTKPLCSLTDVEPLGPKKLLDILCVAPCTGATLGRLCYGISDSAVSLAVKAHLRNERPVVLAISTNDALTASATAIGTLLNRKNYYFVPFSQDDPHTKPRSCVADFSLLAPTLWGALEGKQIQPILK